MKKGNKIRINNKYGKYDKRYKPKRVYKLRDIYLVRTLQKSILINHR